MTAKNVTGAQFHSIHGSARGKLRIFEKDGTFTISVDAPWIGAAIELDPADGARIALAVLSAAGVENAPFDTATGAERAVGYLIEYCGLKMAAAAEEAARAQRREQLVGDLLDSSRHYNEVGPAFRAAVDRIIDTENELAKERAK
ncbi:hypothetical protein JTF08_13610 [Micrococcaceae bacterium RIT802]|nr:hypothetical protein [Micrococcaceae bacterium RIT 802]